MRKKVIIIQRIFSHYRKPVFDELSKRYQLLLLHSKNNSGIEQSTAEYSKNVSSITFFKKETIVFLNAFKSIIHFKPDIIIHESGPGIISQPLTFMLAKLLKSKFVIWGHGYNRKKGFNPKKSLKAKYRLFLMKIADAYILYGIKGKQVLAEYVDYHKLFVAYNTLDTPKFINIRKELETQGLEKIRKQVSFNSKYNIIFIGRLLKSKHPEILIQIFEKLQQRLDNNLAVHFLGNGEMKPDLEKEVFEKGFSDYFFFHGSIYDDHRIGEFLFCSDIMIMPGYLGLSVNHAFCFDCPVISFKQSVNGPFHSPEAEYVIDGKTGFFIEPFNGDKMADKIYWFLTNQELKRKFKQNIRHMIENICSLDKMITGFDDCISFCMKK